MAVPSTPTWLDVLFWTSSTATIAWEYPTGAIDVEIERAASPLGPWTVIDAAAPTNPPEFIDTGLTNLTTYYYRVRAQNPDGYSGYSPVAEVTTGPSPDFSGLRRLYRFRIRNASTETDPNGTADELVITSDRRGTNPYIAEDPRGDGQEIDLLTGAMRTGTYTVRVVDAEVGTDSGGTLRVVTRELEDATYRQQLLSRRAYIEESEDGTSWDVIHAGYVNGIRLATAIAFEFAIGDTRRVETSRRIWTWSAEEGPTGYSERALFPSRGCLAGGPIIGGFGPLADLGGDEYGRPYDSETDPITGRAFLGLYFRAGYLPPAYARATDEIAYGNYLRKVLQPFAESYTLQNGLGLNPQYLALIDESWTWYPALTVIVSDGTTEWTGTLRAAVFGAPMALGVLFDEASSVSPPAAGAPVRVRIVQTEVSESSPLYVDLHPVDIVTRLYGVVGIEWDSSSADVVRDALGPSLRFAMRLTESALMLDFLTRSIFGPFGFSVRNNAAGAYEFYTTRALSEDAPPVTITTDDLAGDGDGVFSLDEASIVSAFKVTYRVLARSTLAVNASPPPPPDGIVEGKVEVVVQNADVSVFSTREVEYVFPGMVHLAESWTPAMGALLSAITRLGFDRYGRGAPTMELAVLRTSAASLLKLGEEVNLDAAHYPNRGYRIGESAVGPRIAQVVRRTITPGAIFFKLVDSGLDLQPVSPAATIEIEISTSAPRTTARFTITNAAAINAATTLGVAVQWAVDASEPTADGPVFARYAPGLVPTGAIALPSVTPGSRVWVRARTEQVERRPSAWTDWEDVTLASFDPPSSLVLSDVTAESITATWVPADASFFTEIFIAPGSSAPADWLPYRVATLLPGSTRAVFRGLDAGEDYRVGVAHWDPGTGYRTTVIDDTETTTTNVATAPTPVALLVIDAEENAGLDVGIALAIYPADEVFDVEIQRAPDASGTPGVWSTIARVAGSTQVYRDLLPSDGLARWYRIRHALGGFNPSSYTGSQSATPGALPLNIGRPSISPVLDVRVEPGDPDYTIYWGGVGTIEVSIDGGAYGAPAPSPITVTRDGSEHTYDFRATLLGVTTPVSRVVVPIESSTVPALVSVSRTEVQAIGCGVNWIVRPSWVTTDPNDTDYKIRVLAYGTLTVVADNQSTFTGGWDDDTGEVGDPLYADVTHSRRYTIELVRISDDTVIDTLDTAVITVDTSFAC